MNGEQGPETLEALAMALDVARTGHTERDQVTYDELQGLFRGAMYVCQALAAQIGEITGRSVIRVLADLAAAVDEDGGILLEFPAEDEGTLG